MLATCKRLGRTWQFAVGVLVISLLYLMTHVAVAAFEQAKNSQVTITPISIVSTSTVKTSTAIPSQASLVAAAAPTATVTATPANLAACTPSSIYLPSLIDLSNAPAGLTQVVEPINTYHVNGNTGAQIRQQIQQCAPHDSGTSIAEFTGQTSFQSSWRFDYTNDGTGNCRVINAKVGMHVMITEPSWQAGPNATAGLNGQWQMFVANLTTHEEGHVRLSQQYAAQMLSDLQNIPLTSCNGIQSTVNAIMQSDINALSAANTQYDDRTNHGATQGAILPQ